MLSGDGRPRFVFEAPRNFPRLRQKALCGRIRQRFVAERKILFGGIYSLVPPGRRDSLAARDAYVPKKQIFAACRKLGEGSTTVYYEYEAVNKVTFD